MAAAASALPLVAARHRTPAYRGEIARQAPQGPWDAVLIDQYGMGWALEQRATFKPGTVFVFIMHDHEENLTALQWHDHSSSWGKRLYFGQNHLKTRWFERRTARACDLLTAITEDDARSFRRTAPNVPIITLTPGYDRPRLESRTIHANTPRTLLILGSFRWSAKQANLRIFLDRADALMVAKRISIRIVGDIADDVRQAFEARYQSTSFTGPVDDPTPHFNTRLAIVAEPIGGGFKLKLLDYIFNRIPVAALEACCTGLPPSVREHMIIRRDLDQLLAAVVDAIDDFPRLNELFQCAFSAAERLYSP